MTTYVDSSVALRIILGSAGALSGWEAMDHVLCSALLEVECLRTLDRLRLLENVPAEEIAMRREAVYDLVSRADVVQITKQILNRASQPLPVPLKTLDAIHVATAMLWQESEQQELVVATHDGALGLAARSVGFRVVGV